MLIILDMIPLCLPLEKFKDDILCREETRPRDVIQSKQLIGRFMDDIMEEQINNQLDDVIQSIHLLLSNRS